ncbi:hypothetical protein D9M72_563940 [compost metagenome]
MLRGDQPRVFQRGSYGLQFLNHGLDVVVERALRRGVRCVVRVDGQQDRGGLLVYREVVHHRPCETDRIPEQGGVDAQGGAEGVPAQGQEHEGLPGSEPERVRDEAEDVGGGGNADCVVHG